MAKFSKLPFQLSDSHALSSFYLIHLDIWGPYKVPTKGNHRYFLTLVDDHSRYTWITLLAYKSDFLSAFQTFHNYVKNQFATTVKQIRSDNALDSLTTNAPHTLLNMESLISCHVLIVPRRMLGLNANTDIFSK